MILRLTVPQGAAPGAVMPVQLPTGAIGHVRIPDGAVPGMQFDVSM